MSKQEQKGKKNCKMHNKARQKTREKNQLKAGSSFLNIFFLSLVLLIQEAFSRTAPEQTQRRSNHHPLGQNTTRVVDCSNIPADKQVINIGVLFPYYELDAGDYIGANILNRFYLADSSYAPCLKIRLSDTYNGSFSIKRTTNSISSLSTKKNVIHIMINSTSLFEYLYTKIHHHPPNSTLKIEFLTKSSLRGGYLPHKQRLLFDLQVKVSLNQNFSEIPDSQMDHPEDRRIQMASQHVKGEVLDLSCDYTRASNIPQLLFMRNSIPMLPYTNKNIFMASMTFTPKKSK